MDIRSVPENFHNADNGPDHSIVQSDDGTKPDKLVLYFPNKPA
jgi:hypothetical protein